MTMPGPATDAPPPNGSSRLSKELKQRIASGIAVATIALLALYWGAEVFAILLGLVGAVMAWEWGGLVRPNGPNIVTGVHIFAVVVATLLTIWGMPGYGSAALIVGAIALAVLVMGSGSAAMSGLGVLYTGLPVIALSWLRNDTSLGLLGVLFVLLAVIATDTAAFFAGRSIGGAKLWPSVSPNKTWSGLIGGVLAAALMGFVFPVLTGSGNSGWLALLGLLLGLVAQAGDLAESALKRSAGVKDASNLIPGHGGFMDRMDGIVTASILAALVALMVEPALPARALLYGS